MVGGHFEKGIIIFDIIIMKGGSAQGSHYNDVLESGF